MECHFKTKVSLELYRNPVSLQGYGGDLGTAVIIFSIVPLDRRRIRKIEIPADQNVWRAPLILIVTRRKRVEAHLKDLAANRISAINKLSFEGKGHGYPSLGCPFRYDILINHQTKINGGKTIRELSFEKSAVSVDGTDRPCRMNQQHQPSHRQRESQTPHPQNVVCETVPGIGETLGLTLLYEIGEIERFPTVKDFLSYCRLVKGTVASAGKIKGLRGAKLGNPYLRWTFG